MHTNTIIGPLRLRSAIGSRRKTRSIPLLNPNLSRSDTKRSYSLLRHLIVLLGCVTIPMALLVVGSVLTQFMTDRRQAEKQLVNQAKVMGLLVDAKLRRLQQAARTLSISSAIEFDDALAVQSEFQAASRASVEHPSAGLPEIVYTDMNGNVVVDSSGSEQRYRPNPAIIDIIRKGDSVITDMMSDGNGGGFVAVVAPVRDRHGSPRGSIILLPHRFSSVTKDSLLLPGASVSLQDRNGITIASSNHEKESLGSQPSLDVLTAMMSTASGLISYGISTSEEVPSTVAFAHAPYSGFIVKIEVPVDEFMAPLKASLLNASVIAAGACIFGLMLAFISVRRIVGAFQLALPISGAKVSTGLIEADDLAQAFRLILSEHELVVDQLRDSEATTARSEERLRALADSIPMLVWSADSDGQFNYFNARCYEFTGVEDFSDKDWFDVIHPDDVDALRLGWEHALKAGECCEMQSRLRRSDGQYRWMLSRSFPVRGNDDTILWWLGTSTDITDIVIAREIQAHNQSELERLVEEKTKQLQSVQRRLAQAERIETLGQLAGGIAHDFNNVIQTFLGGSSLIVQRPHLTKDVIRIGNRMHKAAERGASITSRLLAFARQSDLRAEPVDVASLLCETRDMLTHTIGTGIEVQLDVPADIPPLFADRQQLITALLNLATNARDAMNHMGTLVCSAKLESIDDTVTHRFTILKPGNYIRLAVSDNGCGMDEKTLEKVTEPFFTTKPHGEGTGLGLSIAQGFAEQSGGGLDIQSEIGAGTTVMLYVPVSKQLPVRNVIFVQGKQVRGKIVLVDDDEMVRETIGDELILAGFDVTMFEGGEAALDYIDGGATIDALVADLSMPKMDGVSLIKEAQQRRAGLPAILLTGFTVNAVTTDVTSMTVLRKPVTGPVLAQHIDAMIR